MSANNIPKTDIELHEECDNLDGKCDNLDGKWSIKRNTKSAISRFKNVCIGLTMIGVSQVAMADSKNPEVNSKNQEPILLASLWTEEKGNTFQPASLWKQTDDLEVPTDLLNAAMAWKLSLKSWQVSEEVEAILIKINKESSKDNEYWTPWKIESSTEMLNEKEFLEVIKDSKEFDVLVAKSPISHIESYVKLLEWELNKLDRRVKSNRRIIRKLWNAKTTLNLSLKDKISEQKIKKWLQEGKKINEDNEKWLETIKKELKSIKKQISKQKGDVAMK